MAWLAMAVSCLALGGATGAAIWSSQQICVGFEGGGAGSVYSMCEPSLWAAGWTAIGVGPVLALPMVIQAWRVRRSVRAGAAAPLAS